ncbi:MAG: universal stress protein [Planctomycetota bacterium]|jgi:universal stress protein A|nr:universal stress protein [Planctomycetota bacterium]
MFKRVLLATDFSEHARAAYPWAAEMARKSDGTVVLVHAFEDDLVAAAPALSGYVQTEALDLGQYRDEFRRGSAAALAAAAVEIEALHSQVETHLLEGGGRPWQTIVAAATEHDCGVIVLSTHGRGGLAHILIGSTAEKIVRTAHCPVLTVHLGDQVKD